MESAKAGIVAGEGKAATSERSSFGEISCGAPESVEAVTKKKVAVEQTGKAHGALERGAQYGCMPVVSKAGNRVTWNAHCEARRLTEVCSFFRRAVMKESNKQETRREFGKKVLTLAVGGMFAGAALTGRKVFAADDEKKADENVCKGQNACKGKGGCKGGNDGKQDNTCAGKNACKGKGGCAAAAAKHECKGKNTCKALGGCKSGDNKCAGKNSCKGKGGCAVPVKAEK